MEFFVIAMSKFFMHCCDHSTASLLPGVVSYFLLINLTFRKFIFSYASALAMVASGAVNVKKLITHHYDITETEKAFETARYGHGGAIKVMIHCQPRDKNNPKPFDS